MGGTSGTAQQVNNRFQLSIQPAGPEMVGAKSIKKIKRCRVARREVVQNERDAGCSGAARVGGGQVWGRAVMVGLTLVRRDAATYIAESERAVGVSRRRKSVQQLAACVLRSRRMESSRSSPSRKGENPTEGKKRKDQETRTRKKKKKRKLQAHLVLHRNFDFWGTSRELPGCGALRLEHAGALRVGCTSSVLLAGHLPSPGT